MDKTKRAGQTLARKEQIMIKDLLWGIGYLILGLVDAGVGAFGVATDTGDQKLGWFLLTIGTALIIGGLVILLGVLRQLRSKRVAVG